LVEGKTAVFISHRMSSTKFCDEIAVIDHGKIVEYGSHEDLLKIKDGLYKKMWDAQAQYYR
jgi:ATP-binding cassette subfamily B protein